jgi:hypothetical protein
MAADERVSAHQPDPPGMAAKPQIGAALILAHLLLASFGPMLVPLRPRHRWAQGLPMSPVSFSHPIRHGPAWPRRLEPRRPWRDLVLTLSLSGTILGFVSWRYWPRERVSRRFVRRHRHAAL